jgi:hypothetical protein
MISREMNLGPAPLTTTVDDLATVVLRDLLVSEAESEDGNVEVVDLSRVVGILSM